MRFGLTCSPDWQAKKTPADVFSWELNVTFNLEEKTFPASLNVA